MGNTEYQHLFAKAQDVKRAGKAAWQVQSTGEKLAVAIVLNKPEWIKEMDYTLAEAVDRAAGGEWTPALLLKVASDLRD